ncbi:ABC transporter permease [Halocalculus aciditolerans]|uniref:ABC transporter permease n=1 Tax=Halocalculus aciditolerans TaxID=1383812 RepID=A0A830FE05_9EURY|nr:ABC transporter permease [Halocalculus aciditolerans]GGL66096.1 ABC transporter permease [Halocalculus aciditolerans]
MATERTSGGSGLVTRVRRHRYVGLVFNAAPATFWLGVFFVAPLAVMLYYSFGTRGAFGTVLLDPEHLGIQQYAYFFVPDGASIPQTIWWTLGWALGHFVPFVPNVAGGEPTAYVQLLFKSIYFGVVTTVFAFAIGYPMAYFVARKAPANYRNILVALVVLPYWASYLVRVYAIKIMLAKNGLLDNLLTTLNIADNVSLLYSNFAVGFGLVYIYVPFMILPVYASLEQLDTTLEEAAMDLGADRWDAFRRVTLPLSMPGVIAGSFLVFIPAVGAYVIPELLGGTDTATVGEFIASQFGSAGNWPLGAAAAFILMVIMFLGIWIYQSRTGGDIL